MGASFKFIFGCKTGAACSTSLQHAGYTATSWPAQVLARGEDVIPIPGTKRISAFNENLAALKVNLTPEECKELEDAVPHHQVPILAA
jgi:aryl-alcohol dehydrogenase-like predicted oxidoreductase